MANFGTDSASTAHDGRRSINLTIINGGLFGASAATLDSVSVFGDRDGVGFDKYRLAVYQGGTSDTNPAGASLIWDSGEQTCPSGAAAWRTVTAGGQALAASTRTWVALRTADQFHPHYCLLADEDDATYNAYTWSQNNSATAFEATVPAVSLDGTAAFKWYLTFTIAGGGTTRGKPFGDVGTAFNGGRTFSGIIGKERLWQPQQNSLRLVTTRTSASAPAPCFYLRLGSSMRKAALRRIMQRERYSRAT